MIAQKVISVVALLSVAAGFGGHRHRAQRTLLEEVARADPTARATLGRQSDVGLPVALLEAGQEVFNGTAEDDTEDRIKEAAGSMEARIDMRFKQLRKAAEWVGTGAGEDQQKTAVYALSVDGDVLANHALLPQSFKDAQKARIAEQLIAILQESSDAGVRGLTARVLNHLGGTSAMKALFEAGWENGEFIEERKQRVDDASFGGPGDLKKEPEIEVIDAEDGTEDRTTDGAEEHGSTEKDLADRLAQKADAALEAHLKTLTQLDLPKGQSRKAAAGGLGAIGLWLRRAGGAPRLELSDSSIATLIEKLNTGLFVALAMNPIWYVRVLAAEALGSFGDTSVVSALQAAAKTDPFDIVRKSAREAQYNVELEAYLKTMTQLALPKGEEEVQRAHQEVAAKRLGEVGWLLRHGGDAVRFELSEGAIAALIEKLNKGLFVALAEDPDWYVRVLAAEALGSFGDPSVRHALADAAKTDPSEHVRDAAAEALDSIKTLPGAPLDGGKRRPGLQVGWARPGRGAQARKHR